jgi:serine/threonine protein phosphatase PrpC
MGDKPAGTQTSSGASSAGRRAFEQERSVAVATEGLAALPLDRSDDGATDENRFAPTAIPSMRPDVTQPLDGLAERALAYAQQVPDPRDADLEDLPEVDDVELVGPKAATLPPVEAGVLGAAEGIFGDDPDLPEFLEHEEEEPDALGDKTVDLELPALAQFRDGAISTDESATVEGAPLLDSGLELAARAPGAGEVIIADDGSRIFLEAPLGDQKGSVFFRARVGEDEQAYTAVWTPDPPPEPPWPRMPDPRVVRPRCRATLEGAAVRVFERPKGNTVVDYFGDSDRLLPAMATLELGIELAEILESLHGAGEHLYDLDPSQIVIERGGRVRLYAIGGFYKHGRPPTGQVGVFAAPEVRHRLNYLVGAHSDVFAVALMLYALLARRSPIDTDLDPSLLVSPRLFRPECPLGIWPYLAPCLTAAPGKRIGHARGLRQQLELARSRLLREARAAESTEPVVLEAWAELHTGLGKARRGADQQDRAVAVTDEEGRVGMYIVADGVSRSRYGDGAFAASQVEAATLQRWQALEKAGPAALALSHPQRIDVMRQISRTASKRISAEVNARYAPLTNEPNQVMSSTLSAAFIVGGEATVANLGDSRSYLVREGTIERIAIDHDRTSDALRMGMSFREASEVRMGAALTRVVGRVVIDEDGQSRPDPFEPEIFRVRLLPGDRLLLCSDGVTDFAAGPGSSQAEAEARMLACLLEYEDPARAAYELVVLANRGGGYDNISCVVIAAHSG